MKLVRIYWVLLEWMQFYLSLSKGLLCGRWMRVPALCTLRKLPTILNAVTACCLNVSMIKPNAQILRCFNIQHPFLNMYHLFKRCNSYCGSCSPIISVLLWTFSCWISEWKPRRFILLCGQSSNKQNTHSLRRIEHKTNDIFLDMLEWLPLNCRYMFISQQMARFSP